MNSESYNENGSSNVDGFKQDKLDQFYVNYRSIEIGWEQCRNLHVNSIKPLEILSAPNNDWRLDKKKKKKYIFKMTKLAWPSKLLLEFQCHHTDEWQQYDESWAKRKLINITNVTNIHHILWF